MFTATDNFPNLNISQQPKQIPSREDFLNISNGFSVELSIQPTKVPQLLSTNTHYMVMRQKIKLNPNLAL